MQCRPVHPHLGGYVDYVSAIQDRADRVQAPFDNRQDNQCQSRPPQPDAPRKRRTRVAETGPLTFFTVIKGARGAPGLGWLPFLASPAQVALTRARHSSCRPPGGLFGGDVAPGRRPPRLGPTGHGGRRRAACPRGPPHRLSPATISARRANCKGGPSSPAPQCEAGQDHPEAGFGAYRKDGQGRTIT